MKTKSQDAVKTGKESSAATPTPAQSANIKKLVNPFQIEKEKTGKDGKAKKCGPGFRGPLPRGELPETPGYFEGSEKLMPPVDAADVKQALPRQSSFLRRAAFP